MRREEIIAAIENVRSDSIDVGERARLLGMLHFQAALGHMAPVPMGIQFGQSMRCAWLIVRQLGAVDVEDIQRFRQSERMIGFGLVVIAFCSALALGSGVVIKLGDLLFASSTIPTMLWSVLAATMFVFYVLLMRLLCRPALGEKKHATDQAKTQHRALVHNERFQPWCIRCGYELGGLGSALGDEVWVGPEACPECGHDYPAVGLG